MLLFPVGTTGLKEFASFLDLSRAGIAVLLIFPEFGGVAVQTKSQIRERDVFV